MVHQLGMRSESISRTYQANATVACFLSHVFLMTEIARNFSDDRPSVDPPLGADVIQGSR